MSNLPASANLSPSIYNYPVGAETNIAKFKRRNTSSNTSAYDLKLRDQVTPTLLGSTNKVLDQTEELNAALSQIEAARAEIQALGPRGNIPEIKQQLESLNKKQAFILERLKSTQEVSNLIDDQRTKLNQLALGVLQATSFNPRGAA